jgi:UDP:flavonoid glycosyltransferase YjiC (YdhE family)
MGTGLGHVARLLAIARRLGEHGHRPVLALRNVVEPVSLLREDAFPVLQAPVWQPPPQRRRPATATLADIFAIMGFGDRDSIHSIVTAWDVLIDLVRPKLVVAEFSPGLCLAARGRVPVVAIGSGFCLPPSEMEAFPSLQPKVKPLIRQEDLLASVNAVQGDRDAPSLSRLPALFDVDGQFVFALPILDPYAALRAEPAAGMLNPLPEAAPPPSEPHVYVYYGMELPGVKPLMDGLGQAGLPATVYLRGAPPGLLRRLQRPGLRFLDSPPRYGDILPLCSVAVHYGGLGTASACLGAGRPQLVLPRQLERRLTAAFLNKLRVGGTIPGKFTADQFASALLRMVNEPAFAANAAAVAADLERPGEGEVLDRIVERCLALIDEKQGSPRRGGWAAIRRFVGGNDG